MKNLTEQKEGNSIKVYKNNLLIFSYSERKDGNVDVRFSSMKPNTGRSKYENKQYEKFLDILKENNVNYSLSPSKYPIFRIEHKSLEKLMSSAKIQKLLEDFVSCDGIWKNYQIDKIEFDNKVCLFRKNVVGEYNIVKEAFTGNTYEGHGMTFDKNDVVLDLGANIGCFTLSIFNRVKKVILVEPDKVNCDLIKMNIEANSIKNYELYQAAVVGNKDKKRKLFCGVCPGMYSLHTPTHSRISVEVNCVNIQDLIDKYNPTKIKFDIKGSEIECVKSITNWRNVNQIAFDYCFDINGDLKNGHKVFSEFKKKLKKDGFDISPMERDMKSNWNLVFLLNKKK